MTWSVSLLPQAKRQIEETITWWAKHRSQEQATRWLAGIYAATAKLGETALLHSIAPEAKTTGLTVRHAPFGLGAKPTHRIVYLIEGNEVLVLAIRHVSQRPLRRKDLDSP